MKKPKHIYEALLPVVLLGEGCTLCPALRYRHSDEQRYCSEARWRTLEDWKHQRGPDCPLREIRERTE